jgi:TRAP-type C4-dicarboxylate transport system substrate-binding protein
MMREPQGTSRALWDYVQQHASKEFADVKLLATHVHGPGVLHTTNREVRTLAHLKGLKLRAPTRQANRFLAALGATPVAMPVPQVGEAMAKGVIDGALIPWDVVPSVKVQELARFHAETDPALPAFYTATFIFAMNKSTYAALPAELKRVVDANSGQALSGEAGRAFAEADVIGRKTAPAGTIKVIPRAELEHWVKLGLPLAEAWVADVTAKGANGRQLLADARALIARHTVR